MPPTTPAGSKPVELPVDVCEVLCEVPFAPSKNHGSVAASTRMSPSWSVDRVYAALTERAPAALSANSTRSSAICCLSFTISAFSASVASAVLAALATLPWSSAFWASLALSALRHSSAPSVSCLCAWASSPACDCSAPPSSCCSCWPSACVASYSPSMWDIPSSQAGMKNARAQQARAHSQGMSRITYEC